MAFYTDNSGQQTAKRARIDYHQPGVTNVCQVSNSGNIPMVMSTQYIEQQLNKKPTEPEKPNHILLFTIFNPNYPITCEVLHTICSPVGKVLRIVIFRKNGVQAMVEFESLDAARAAKESLYGCDIYSGCCTLKIEFAKPSKLNVYKNDLDSFDYTNPNPGKPSGPDSIHQTLHSGPQRPVLLKEPLLTKMQVAGNGIISGICENTHEGPTSCFAVPEMLQSHHPMIRQNQTLGQQGNPFFRPNGTPSCQTVLTTTANLTSAGNSTSPTFNFTSQGSVCMVYGLNAERMNANKLFNLFCLYGNVTRVKFLKTKEGCAMVQLGDSAAAERAIANLNNVSFFRSKMQVGYSKQAFLADVQAPYVLPDGTPSFQDFMGSKNNRFMNPEMASKNRIQPPTKILHFFNTPPTLADYDVEKLFVDQGLSHPKSIKIFPSKTDRSSSGLVEFETQSDALEAIVCCNHLPINNPAGKFPYIMKLCFSSSKNITTPVRPI